MVRRGGPVALLSDVGALTLNPSPAIGRGYSDVPEKISFSAHEESWIPFHAKKQAVRKIAPLNFVSEDRQNCKLENISSGESVQPICTCDAGFS